MHESKDLCRGEEKAVCPNNRTLCLTSFGADDDAADSGLDGQGSAALAAGLFQHMVDVILHGTLRNVQLLRNGGIGDARGHDPQHLQLPFCQLGPGGKAQMHRRRAVGI